MIISFGGAPGSGKSTIAQMLADKLGWTRYYIGGLRRDIAKKRGLTLAEYNKLGENDPSTDREVDDYQKKLGKTADNFIIEGRTSWYFIPRSLKIFLDVSKEEGAKRIFGHLQEKNDRNENAALNSLEAVKKSVAERLASDQGRYQRYYGVDVSDRRHYDLYLDTTLLTIDQVFQAVYDFVRSRLDKKKN